MSLIYEKPKEIKYSHLDRMKHMSWCLANDIKIYFRPDDGWNKGRIVTICKGKTEISKEYYAQLAASKRARKLGKKEHKWAHKIFELYTEKYLKYNKDARTD